MPPAGQLGSPRLETRQGLAIMAQSRRNANEPIAECASGRAALRWGRSVGRIIWLERRGGGGHLWRVMRVAAWMDGLIYCIYCMCLCVRSSVTPHATAVHGWNAIGRQTTCAPVQDVCIQCSTAVSWRAVRAPGREEIKFGAGPGPRAEQGPEAVCGRGTDDLLGCCADPPSQCLSEKRAGEWPRSWTWRGALDWAVALRGLGEASGGRDDGEAPRGSGEVSRLFGD